MKNLSVLRSRSLRFKLLLGIITLLIPLTSFAIVKALTTKNAHSRGIILYVGDSNLHFAASNVVNVMTNSGRADNGYNPVFAPRIGAGIRTPDCLIPEGCTTTDFWQIKLGEILAKVDPDFIVNNLGVNDTAWAGDATSLGYANYDQKIDWFMSIIPSETQVLWSNLPCPILHPSRLYNCREVNAALSAAQSRWTNLTMLKWNSQAATHPEYMSSDGIHYSPTGSAAWANFVGRELDTRSPVPSDL